MAAETCIATYDNGLVQCLQQGPDTTSWCVGGDWKTGMVECRRSNAMWNFHVSCCGIMDFTEAAVKTCKERPYCHLRLTGAGWASFLAILVVVILGIVFLVLCCKRRRHEKNVQLRRLLGLGSSTPAMEGGLEMQTADRMAPLRTTPEIEGAVRGPTVPAHWGMAIGAGSPARAEVPAPPPAPAPPPKPKKQKQPRVTFNSKLSLQEYDASSFVGGAPPPPPPVEESSDEEEASPPAASSASAPAAAATAAVSPAARGSIAMELPLEQQVTLWVEQLSGEERGIQSFVEWLRDGTVLCKVANTLQPGIIPTVHISGMPFKQMENITSFTKACRTLGVLEKDIFSTVDLYEAKNLQTVMRCIYNLGSIVRKTAPAFQGPYLGVAQNARVEDQQREARRPSQAMGLRQDVAQELRSAGMNLRVAGMTTPPPPKAADDAAV